VCFFSIFKVSLNKGVEEINPFILLALALFLRASIHIPGLSVHKNLSYSFEVRIQLSSVTLPATSLKPAYFIERKTVWAGG